LAGAGVTSFVAVVAKVVLEGPGDLDGAFATTTGVLGARVAGVEPRATALGSGVTLFEVAAGVFAPLSKKC
jgi:hypothetical protein